MNIFLPNRAEACALTGAPEVEKAARRLAGFVEVVAVKLEAEGALGVQGERVVRVPSLSVAVVDTVGAGDNFDAGFPTVTSTAGRWSGPSGWGQSVGLSPLAQRVGSLPNLPWKK